MKKNYDKFIKEFQTKLDKYFEEYSEYIYCHENCSDCCETGEYPFSELEMSFLMQGFLNLPQDIKAIIKNNIENLKKQKSEFQGERFEYTCPFLIDKKCSVYKNRGITCRVHGLAYLRKNNTVNIPYCANKGLNFSSVFKEGIFSIKPIKENLNIDEVLKPFKEDMGEIRPLINWFLQK